MVVDPFPPEEAFFPLLRVPPLPRLEAPFPPVAGLLVVESPLSTTAPSVVFSSSKSFANPLPYEPFPPDPVDLEITSPDLSSLEWLVSVPPLPDETDPFPGCR